MGMAKDYDAEGCVITKASIPRLHLAALGIVFGDAGTSP
jgi:K+ transporter